MSRWNGQSLVGLSIKAPVSEFVFRSRPEPSNEDSDLGVGRRRKSGQALEPSTMSAVSIESHMRDAVVSDTENTPCVIGTVNAYNAALDKFYVSWGDLTSDKHSNLTCRTVENVLIAAGASCNIIRFIPPWISCKAEPYDGKRVGYDVNVCATVLIETNFGDIESYVGRKDVKIDDMSAPTCGNDDHCPMELVPVEEVCALCRKEKVNFLDSVIREDSLDIIRDDELYAQVYNSVFELRQCTCCLKKYHEGCMPDVASDQAEKWRKVPRTNQSSNWKCWFCLECEECKISAWDSKLVKINIADVEFRMCSKVSEIDACEKVVCSGCAEKYSDTKKEYCPVCTKVYPSDEELVAKSRAAIAVRSIAGLAPTVLPTFSLNHEGPSKPYFFPELTGSDLQSGVGNESLSSAMQLDTDEKAQIVTQNANASIQVLDDVSDGMVECSECGRWVHAKCESINSDAFEAIGNCSHPIWGGEYLCPKCRFNLCDRLLRSLEERDIYGLFALPVNDDVAPGYSEMIRNPMDLSTMRGKLSTGAYKSLQTLRQDFELVCENAFKFNKHGDKYWKAALIFFLRGESVFSKSRISSLSVYGKNILKLISRDEVRKIISSELNKAMSSKSSKSHGSGVKDSLGATLKEVSTTKSRPQKVAGHVALFEKNGYQIPPWLNQWLTETPNESKMVTSSRRQDTMKDENRASVATTNEYAKERINYRGSRYSNARQSESSIALPQVSKTDSVDNIASKLNTGQETDMKVTGAPAVSQISLPCKLVASSIDDVVSYVKTNVLTLAPEIAFFDCCRDKCLICGCTEITDGSNSLDDTATMIFCTVCGEGFHSFCIFPNQSDATDVRSDWKCTNCSTCVECDDAYGSSPDSYIYCDGCDRAYHLACISPKLCRVPSGDWFCRVRPLVFMISPKIISHLLLLFRNA